jgi:heat shock protein HtpX
MASSGKVRLVAYGYAGAPSATSRDTGSVTIYVESGDASLTAFADREVPLDTSLGARSMARSSVALPAGSGVRLTYEGLPDDPSTAFSEVDYLIWLPDRSSMTVAIVVWGSASDTSEVADLAATVIPTLQATSSPASPIFLALLLAAPALAGGTWLRYRRASQLTFQAQESANRARSIALVGVLVAVLAALGFIIAFVISFDPGGSSMVGLVVAGIGLAATPFAYFFGGGMTLAAAGAKPVGADEKVLNDVVSEMSLAAGLPRPAVYLIATDAPNAMATGRDRQHASIAVTSGLLTRLDREELQGVIAHEMSHIRNLDMRYSMLVAVLVGVIVLITDLFFQGTLRAIVSGSWMRVRGKNALAGALTFLLFLVFLLAVAAILRLLAPIAAAGVQAAVSRQREYLADATAVELDRNPKSLERALETIGGADDRMTAANRAITHLYFVNPTFSEADSLHEGSAAGWRGFFSTHPSILDRVNRLRVLEGQGPLGGKEASALATES